MTVAKLEEKRQVEKVNNNRSLYYTPDPSTLTDEDTQT
jgi:hypothetical protein